jgi:hypothetical protein
VKTDTVRRSIPPSAIAFVSVGALVIIARSSLRVDFYFDEMWRVDMIKTPWTLERYRLHDTPAPPGWLAGMWVTFEALPARRPVLRLVSIAPYALAASAMVAALHRALIAGNERRASMLAGTAVLPMVLTPSVAHAGTYVNNYMTEMAVGALVVWAVAEWQSSGSRRAALGVFLIAIFGPFFSLSGMLMLPFGLIATVATRRRSTSERRVVIGCVVAQAASTLVCFGVFLNRVRPSTSLTDFWAAEMFRLGTWYEFPGRWWTVFVDQFIPRTLSDWSGLTAVFGVAFALGLWRAWRLFPPLVAMVVGAQTSVLVLSLIAGWPATLVRVNLGFAWPLLITGFVGVAVGILDLTRRINRARTRNLATLATAAVLALGVLASWPRDVTAAAGTTEPFARGLSDDIESVAVELEPLDVVVTYHPMAAWYSHDRLRAAREQAEAFDELTTEAERLYRPLDAMVGDQAPRLWCIIPYEVGPTLAAKACLVSETNWQLTEERLATRSVIQL